MEDLISRVFDTEGLAGSGPPPSHVSGHIDSMHTAAVFAVMFFL